MRLERFPRLDDRGVGLAELLSTVALVGLILTGLLALLVTGNEAYLTGATQVEAQEGARAVLERMTHEIRMAGYDPQGAATFSSVVGPPGSNAPTATGLTIQKDNDGDGVVAATERVAYMLSGSDLLRQDFAVDPAPQTILTGVQALTFSYFDAAGGALAAPVVDASIPSIRSIQIQITTRSEKQAGSWSAGKVSVTMADGVRLRNR